MISLYKIYKLNLIKSLVTINAISCTQRFEHLNVSWLYLVVQYVKPDYGPLNYNRYIDSLDRGIKAVLASTTILVPYEGRNLSQSNANCSDNKS